MTSQEPDKSWNDALTLTVRRGSLYLSAGTYGKYFAGLHSVILLRRGNDLVIMPVRNTAAGGYLLKLKNAAGDRVVNAPDFFGANGFMQDEERHLSANWCRELHALVSSEFFADDN